MQKKISLKEISKKVNLLKNNEIKLIVGGLRVEEPIKDPYIVK